jgi:sugar phosphate isomerase/epimerase
MHRRHFVQAAFSVATVRRLFAARKPNIVFPTEARARLGVASYPFRAFIDSPHNRDRDKSKPGMRLTEFPAMVREKFNVRNVELLDSHFESLEPTYLSTLRNAVEKAGCHVINLPVNVQASLYDPDAGQRKTGVDHAKKWVDAAVLLGSPSIRVHIQGVNGVKPDVGRTADSLRTVADYGAQKNVLINLENDDIATEDAFFLVKVIEQVNSPWLHGLPDFCNSMLKGDEKYNYDAVAAMFQHAYNISHVKDSEMDNGKLFRIDVGKTFAIAKQSGYRGYFSMEWEGDGGPYEGTQKLIEASLQSL